MIKLRIYRTWDWVCTGTRIGDPNPPYELVGHDKLQFCPVWEQGDETWADVPIVEAEKPEHPREARMRKDLEAASIWIEERMKKIYGIGNPL